MTPTPECPRVEPTPAKRREIYARVRRRMAPTLGAVVLCSVLATWIGYNAVQGGRADERLAAEVRVDACKRGNVLRSSQRESNAVLSGLLDSILEPQRPSYLRARADLMRHLQTHPDDVTARFSLEATRPNSATRQAVHRAQALLATQDRLLAPIACEEATTP